MACRLVVFVAVRFSVSPNFFAGMCAGSLVSQPLKHLMSSEEEESVLFPETVIWDFWHLGAPWATLGAAGMTHGGPESDFFDFGMI